MKTSADGSVAGLERAFQALADEKRLRILALLQDGECCVCDMASALDMRQSLLSFHLKTLREAGLVTDRKEGRWVHYALERESARRVGDYLIRLAREARRGLGIRCCHHGTD